MTQLRPSDLDPNVAGVDTERIELFGRTVPSNLGLRDRTAGWARSLGQGLTVDGWGYAKDQYWTIGDWYGDGPSQQLTPERYDEMREEWGFEEHQAPYDPSLTERQFRGQLSRTRRNEYLGTFERSLAGHGFQFLGGIAGSIAAPESLASIPFGGASAQAAVRTKRLADAMRLSMRSGLEMVPAATGLNLIAQETVYGQVDGLELTMNALAPLVLAPVGVAFGRAFTPREVAAVSDAAHGAPLPEPIPTRPDAYTPAALSEQFEGYPGGVEAWLAAVARRDPSAAEFGQALGITPEAYARVQDVSLFEASRSPLDDAAVRDLDALSAYALGEPSAGQLQWLLDRGMVREAEATRGAVRRPGFEQVAEDRIRLRGLEARRADVAERFPEVAGALRWAEFLRAGGRTDVPMQESQQLARRLMDAVEGGNASLAPVEFQPLVARLLEAERVDLNARRIAYAQEGRTRDAIAEAVADGSPRVQERFVREVMRDLPETMRGDWEALRSGGLEAVRVRYADRLAAEMDEHIARLGALAETAPRRRGRPTRAEQAHRDAMEAQRQEVRGRIAAMEATLERFRAEATREPESMSVDRLAEVLNEARWTAPVDPRPPQTGQAEPTNVAHMDEATMDAIVAEYEAYARANGVNPDEVGNSYAGAMRAIRECAV